MPRCRVLALAAVAVLVAPAAWAQPDGTPALPGALAPPLGPALSCADFVHNADKTWSITHPAKIIGNGVSATLWPGTRFAIGLPVAGGDVAALVNQACGGPAGPPRLVAQPNPVTPPPGPWTPGPPDSAHPPPGPPMDGTHGQQAAPPHGQAPPGTLAPPLGPGLSCADFVRHDDGTWSITHSATINYDGISVTLWPTTRFALGLFVAGKDFAALLQQCGGAASPPPAPPPAPQPGLPNYPPPVPPPAPTPGCPTSPPPSPSPGTSPGASPGSSPASPPAASSGSSPGSSPASPPAPSPGSSPASPPSSVAHAPGVAPRSAIHTPPGPSPRLENAGQPGPTPTSQSDSPPRSPPPGPPPGALPPPLGPALSCSDFVRNDDGTWSAAHPVPIHTSAASITLGTLAHFRAGSAYAGVDIGHMLEEACAGQ